MKTSPYLNDDGTFKGGFDGCVLHMTSVEGHSDESAKKICGHIAQEVGAKEILAGLQFDTEIVCHMSLGAPATAEGEFMFMPGGRHAIHAFQGLGNRKPISLELQVDAQTAASMQSQLAAVSAKSDHRPYFDFGHSDGEASFWPTEFVWKDSPKPGVYARGEWSAQGKAAVEGKMYRSFSPVFHVDDNKPARVRSNPEARLNFGGLVNNPAFRQNLPILGRT